jgi:hypothetical protein
MRETITVRIGIYHSLHPPDKISMRGKTIANSIPSREFDRVPQAIPIAYQKNPK